MYSRDVMKTLFVMFGFILLSSSRACQDTHGSVSNGFGQECLEWSVLGECHKSPRWMNKNCQRTCNACHIDVNGCVDHYPNATECQQMADDGDCESNPRWMKRNCQKTCNACSAQVDGCVDFYGNVTNGIGAECSRMAKSGECIKNNAVWMQKHCVASCYSCQSTYLKACEDRSFTCKEDRELGWCTDKSSFYYNYTQEICRRTCQLCDKPIKECNGDTPASPHLCDDHGDQAMRDFICIRRAVECCHSCRNYGNTTTTSTSTP